MKKIMILLISFTVFSVNTYASWVVGLGAHATPTGCDHGGLLCISHQARNTSKLELNKFIGELTAKKVNNENQLLLNLEGGKLTEDLLKQLKNKKITSAFSSIIPKELINEAYKKAKIKDIIEDDIVIKSGTYPVNNIGENLFVIEITITVKGVTIKFTISIGTKK
jgi:hypothetical protein